MVTHFPTDPRLVSESGKGESGQHPPPSSTFSSASSCGRRRARSVPANIDRLRTFLVQSRSYASDMLDLVWVTDKRGLYPTVNTVMNAHGAVVDQWLESMMPEIIDPVKFWRGIGRCFGMQTEALPERTIL